ncbi:MAG: tetratricopeptide repeat protein, partial [Terriglobales bacterium]
RLAGMKDEIQKQFPHPGLLGDKAQSEDAAYSESFYAFSSFGWSPLHALQTSRYHYIEAPVPELFDVQADPQEKNNLAPQQTATVAVLEDKLQALLRQNPFKPGEAGTSGLSPDALEKLRALGYVAYRSPVSPEALAAGLPDPKSKLWEVNSILEAADAFQAGDFPAGDALLVQVQQKDPQMYIVPFMLGEAATRQQRWDEAAAAFQKCLELNPNFDQAMTGLARVFMYLGKLDEAIQWSRRALQQNPANYRAWYQLGLIESKTDKNAAIADYEKGVAIQGSFAPLRRDLGMLYFQQQNYAEAAKHLAQAAELGVDDAPLYNFLGISYGHTNRLAKAVASYKHALKLDPTLAEAHLNLGFAYQKLDQPAAAQKEYAEACRLQEKFCHLVPAARP